MCYISLYKKALLVLLLILISNTINTEIER